MSDWLRKRRGGLTTVFEGIGYHDLVIDNEVSFVMHYSLSTYAFRVLLS
jgi:hypothetical protein